MIQYANQHTQSLHFLRAHYPESVKRFEEEGNRVLEELLAQNLSDEEPPRLKPTPYPKLKIEIKQTRLILPMTKGSAQETVRHFPMMTAM
jgi:hypothetical protein